MLMTPCRPEAVICVSYVLQNSTMCCSTGLLLHGWCLHLLHCSTQPAFVCLMCFGVVLATLTESFGMMVTSLGEENTMQSFCLCVNAEKPHDSKVMLLRMCAVLSLMIHARSGWQTRQRSCQAVGSRGPCLGAMVLCGA